MTGIPDDFSLAEVDLAARNHALLLETLDYPITPMGLHYLLNHFDVPRVDADAFRLQVDGRVDRPLSLGLDQLRARPPVSATVTMECAGNGRATLLPRPRTQAWVHGAVGTATWSGTRLGPLLAEAGVLDGAVDLVFTGLDHGIEGGIEQDYARSLSVEQALEGDAILAWELNGAPLPPQHGFPLRLIVPGWYGMASVKWLTRITAVAEPFRGYYQVQAYCARRHPDEPGEPLDRMLPRSLLIPPGIAEFPSRRRFLDRGPCRLRGRAWSGFGAVDRVEVSWDGGETWQEASLERDLGDRAWCAWSAGWDAGPGDHVLCSRAHDTTGRVQPLEQAWNLGGYGNNAVQRVVVTVR